MNLIHKSIKYINEERIFIPFEGKLKSCIKRGESFQKGQEFFKVERRKLLDSYYLPEDLGVNTKNTLDFVTRIEGEYVSKEDIIAERLISSGLLSKRVTSEYEGIVNLSNADLGYVNILSELGVQSVVATFDGIVRDIDFSKGLLIESDVCQLPMFYTNKKGNSEFFGNFEILSDTESVPSFKKMQKSFEGKVVFAGRFLYPQLAKELFKRGCKFVLASSMNYDDFENLDVPVGILSGFGNISFDSARLDFLKELVNHQVSVDIDSGVIQFPVGINDKVSRLFEQKYYTEVLKKGDIVKSRDLESFGLIGEILSVDAAKNTVEVLMQEGTTFLIDRDSLELYSEEFSLMRTRIL